MYTHAVVFDTKPIAFAVRDLVAGVDLDAIAQPGQGMALWLHAPDAQEIHDALAAAGTTIISAPVDGPFGRMFTFADPDGYQGDPPRPRLSRAQAGPQRVSALSGLFTASPSVRVRPGPPPKRARSCVLSSHGRVAARPAGFAEAVTTTDGPSRSFSSQPPSHPVASFGRKRTDPSRCTWPMRTLGRGSGRLRRARGASRVR